jgi:S-adenosylmethionine synthetase
VSDYIAANFDMRPRAIIEQLDLLRPIYRPTAAYGHFGRKGFTWERTNRAKKMAKDLLGAGGRAATKKAKSTASAKPAIKRAAKKVRRAAKKVRRAAKKKGR